jgi:WD40 repeat protein
MNPRNRIGLWFLIILINLSFIQVTNATQTIFDFGPLAIEWSPDGNRIAVASAEGIRIFDANFRQINFYNDPAPDPNDQFAISASRWIFPYPSWSPDSTRLTAGRVILDASTLQVLQTFDDTRGLGPWTPDGQYVLASGGGGFAIDWYDVQTGQLARQLTFTDIYGPALELSSDNTRFLITTSGTLRIVNASTGATLAEYTFPYRVKYAQWSPDGHRVSFVAGDTMSRPTLDSLIVIDSATGEITFQSEPTSESMSFPTWSSDGMRIAVRIGPRSITFWDVNSGSVIDTHVAPENTSINAISYSPFGGRFAYLVHNQEISVDTRPQSQSAFQEAYMNGAIQVIAPAPSVERLATITAACGLPARTEAALDQQAATDLTAFTAQVAALPDTQIPPGCRADLLAVAAALQAQ